VLRTSLALRRVDDPAAAHEDQRDILRVRTLIWGRRRGAEGKRRNFTTNRRPKLPRSGFGLMELRNWAMRNNFHARFAGVVVGALAMAAVLGLHDKHSEQVAVGDRVREVRSP
jgi:hypothetical protein